MSKKRIWSVFAGILIITLIVGCGTKETNSKAAANHAPVQQAAETAPAPQAGKADYSRLLNVTDVQNITGQTNLQLKSIDAKKSGEAADLTFSTVDGQRIVMVQVLKGTDFDMYYEQFRGQDYKAWPNAFWGPKQTNPPSMFAFRKGDTLIMITTDLDSKEKPYITPDMFENIAKIITSRL